MEKLKNKIIEWYKGLPPEKKGLVKTATIWFAVLFLIIFVFTTTNKAKTYSLSNNTYVTPFRYILDVKVYVSSAFIAAAITTIIILLVYNPNDLRNKAAVKDEERDISLAEKQTSGSAHFMTLKEAEKAYLLANVGDSESMVFGRLKKEDDPGQRLVQFKPKPFQEDGSGLQNTLILGNSGSGKSFGFVRTEIINSILRGDSVLVSDPSGELYTDLSYWCRSRGADVKVLNLSNLDHSDGWDCLKECVDVKTKRLDGSRLNAFVTIYLENTPNKGGSADGFWKGQNANYLKAAIGYLFWKRDLHLIKCYKYLYKKVTGGKGEYRSNSYKFYGDVSFVWCEKTIRDAAIENGYDLKEVDDALLLAQKTAPECTLRQIKDVFNNFDEVTKFFSHRKFPNNDPAKGAYDDIKRSLSSEAIVISSLTGVINELSILTDKKLSYVLSRDEIVTSNINKKQSIYFLCMDTQSAELKPIASLFVSFLLKNAYEQYNLESSLAKEAGRKNYMVDTTVMLDEFYSLGKIGGSTDYFSLYISNSRKAHMHTNIILQNITQLPAVYGKELTATIESNCLFTIVLGANDLETCQYVSDFLCGETTIIDSSHTVNSHLFNRPTSSEVKISSKSRKLMTYDEVRRFKDGVLLVQHGEQPIKLDPFPYIEHPIYTKGLLKYESANTSIKSYDAKVSEEYENIKVLTGKDFLDFVNKLKHQIINPETGEVELINSAIEMTKEFKSIESGKDEDEQTEDTVAQVSDDSALSDKENKTEKVGEKTKSRARRDKDNLLEINESSHSILSDD